MNLLSRKELLELEMSKFVDLKMMDLQEILKGLILELVRSMKKLVSF